MRSFGYISRPVQPVRDSRPLLSFLYCTQTIRQGQQRRPFTITAQSQQSSSEQIDDNATLYRPPPGLSGRSRFSHTPQLDAQNSQPSKRSITPSRRQSANGSSAYDGAAELATLGHTPTESSYSSPYRASRQNGRKTGRSMRQKLNEGRVPFNAVETAPTERPFNEIKRESASPNSTLTAAEYRAFQSLLALQQSVGKPPMSEASVQKESAQKKSTQKEAEQQGDKPLTTDEVLEKAMGIKIIRYGAHDYGPPLPVPTTSPPIAFEVQDGELNKIRALMMDGQRDEAVWDILQQKVFARLRRISMPELQHSLSVQQLSEPADASSTAPKASPSDSDDVASKERAKKNSELMQSLPGHLMNFQKVLAAHYPSSLYGLSILPHLQRQGDAVFALGASTELYNTHLRQLHLKHYDIASMVKVLQEMHDKVYDFDGETLEIVNAVLGEAGKASDGDAETARAVLWDCEQMRGLRRALEGWQKNIEEQISQRALHELRSHEEQSLQQHAGMV